MRGGVNFMQICFFSPGVSCEGEVQIWMGLGLYD